mgnify:CR=1 FL=1
MGRGPDASYQARLVSGDLAEDPAQAAAIARHADAAVVGSAIVERVKAGLDDNGKAKPDLVPGVFAYIRALADGVRAVRKA